MLDEILIALGAGGTAGLLTSLFFYWRTSRRSRGYAPVMETAHDEQINAAARQWAAAHGRLAAAPLVANKLRLAYRINRRRRFR